eukprot:TRINITY_DN2418_c0_g1_i1.p1 TRINITY_DN2418_c0_g1~~TRINITY_DN2418_c0_g1_i1.p1  ORF type:complete len:187 (+),score=23.86 TRINITY_DN2418_c0_g1_i1:430-990(+)
MLLGKRSRSLRRRSSSMSLIDLDSAAAEHLHRDKPKAFSGRAPECVAFFGVKGFMEEQVQVPLPSLYEDSGNSFFIPEGSAMQVSGIGVGFGGSNSWAFQHRRITSEPAHFLQACFLCNRWLAGKDIYMYRGDSAFCSKECRETQIVLDEWMEKGSVSAMTESVSGETIKGGNRQKARGETLAAAA